MDNWIRVVQRVDAEATAEAHSQPMQILYELDGAGWAKCLVRSDVAVAQVTASYLSDSLRNLVLSALAIVADFRHVEFSFDEEPGQYRWVIEATGPTTIDVLLLEFPHLGSNAPNDEGQVLLLVHTNRNAYAEAVRAAAATVLSEHGIAGYAELWHMHAFPARELQLLETSLEALNRGA